MRGSFFAIGLMLALSPLSAQAMDRDVRAVTTTAEYGVLGGTLLGLAAWPVTKQVRSVFIGASVGLYLGIAVGIYHVSHRDDPENPLHVEDERSRDPVLAAREAPGLAASYPPWVQAEVPVARF